MAAEFLYLLWFSYFVLQMYLYSNLEFSEPIATKDRKSLFVQDEAPVTWTDKASTIMEYCVLNRYSMFGYKNSVRSNARIFASILQTAFVFLTLNTISSFLKLDLTWNTTGFWTIAGYLVSSFVLERKALYDKWLYLAGLYNKSIEKPYSERPILEAALAFDLLEMEMWSHRSFRECFEDTVAHAYLTYLKDNPFDSKTVFEMKEALRNKRLAKAEIRDVLHVYQKRLVEHSYIAEVKKTG